MGLPIRMVAAVTPNDIVHRTLQVRPCTSTLANMETSLSQTGDFSLSPVVLQTWATAMDIQATSGPSYCSRSLTTWSAWCSWPVAWTPPG